MLLIAVRIHRHPRLSSKRANLFSLAPVAMQDALAPCMMSASSLYDLCSCQRCLILRAGIFLMGYGLVAIPRLLWRTADARGQRRLLTHQAGMQADQAIAARMCGPAACTLLLSSKALAVHVLMSCMIQRPSRGLPLPALRNAGG